MLIRIKGAISNCYLLLGERPVLVDTGAPGDLKRILAALKHAGIAPKDLSLILLTHGHSNHAGCAAELKRRGAPQVALHAGDVTLVRQGRNGVLAAQDVRQASPAYSRELRLGMKPAGEPDRAAWDRA